MRIIKPYFRYKDKRGVLAGIVNEGIWREINIVCTKRKTIRGEHFHKKAKELFYIIRGKIDVEIFDLKTKKKNKFTAKKSDIFLIEPFEVHTFKVISDAVWLNMLSRPHDKFRSDIYKYNFITLKK